MLNIFKNCLLGARTFGCKISLSLWINERRFWDSNSASHKPRTSAACVGCFNLPKNPSLLPDLRRHLRRLMQWLRCLSINKVQRCFYHWENLYASSRVDPQVLKWPISRLWLLNYKWPSLVTIGVKIWRPCLWKAQHALDEGCLMVTKNMWVNIWGYGQNIGSASESKATCKNVY